MSILNYITKMSRIKIQFIAYLTSGIICLIDFHLSVEVSFSLFYLIPVFLVTWTGEKVDGFLISIFSALLWLVADLLSGRAYSHLAIHIWNAGMRLGFFTIVTILLTYFRKLLDMEKTYSQYDFLTGLHTIRYFYQRANEERARAIRYKKKLTMVYIDLDNFKIINDTSGHQEGNRILKEIAAVMKNNLRITDLIGRLGGDEFAILLPESNTEQASEVITKLHKSLMHETKKYQWPITFSIGAVTYNNIPDSIDEMIRNADDLMYSVKKTGKNAIKQKMI